MNMETQLVLPMPNINTHHESPKLEAFKAIRAGVPLPCEYGTGRL